MWGVETGSLIHRNDFHAMDCAGLFRRGLFRNVIPIRATVTGCPLFELKALRFCAPFSRRWCEWRKREGNLSII